MINWGTRSDSLLSNLITSIFSHFTDVEWESLIPKVGNVTGTLEHRWDDVRTDHKVTPGVIYTPSTHFTVNTNHFKPEHHFDPIAENVNVNYQLIFSKISAYNTFKCFYQPQIPGTMHWHVKCSDCLISVNEDMLDLKESDELIEILEKYAQPSTNPYLWVSGSKFNIMSFKFPVYNLTSPEDFTLSWRNLLTQSLVGWVLDHHPIMNDNTIGGNMMRPKS